jgi:predicted nucleotidyltransferase
MSNPASLNASLHLAPAHLSLVKAILSDHVPHARVLAFGSRAAGTPRKYSDLDLAIIQPEPLTLRTISRLKIAFEDSDLPICVDVVDWNRADSEFKAMVAKRGMVELQH